MTAGLHLTRRAFVGSSLALLAGCGGGRASTGPAGVVKIASIGYVENGRLNVGGNQTSPVYVQGQLEKALAERGAKLEWLPISNTLGGPGFNEALANRAADFAAYGDFPAIIARASGIPIRLVVPAGRGSNSYLVVSADSPARSISDLTGKGIAVQRGRPHELPFSQLIASAGLSHGDFSIFNINAAAGVAAVVSGKVDAAFIGPEAYLLEDRGVARIIWSSKSTNWKWRSELFVHDEFADANPELVQTVVDMYVAAARWSSDEANRDEAQRLISRTGVPLSVVQRDAEGDIPWRQRWSPLFDDYMRKHYREAIDFAFDQGLIRQRFDVEEFFEPRYAVQSLSRLDLAGYWTERTDVA